MAGGQGERIITDELRKKLSDCHKGIVHTEESKAKISEIMKEKAP